MPDPHPSTHQAIDQTLCGEPLALAVGSASVQLVTRAEMRADERGLVHGGFVFGLADYAAMLAIVRPNVVLGAAQVRFLAPCVVGDRLVAEARLEESEGAKKRVNVEVLRGDVVIFSGLFICFVPPTHILERAE